MPPSGALAASCAPASGAWAAWAAPVGGKAAGACGVRRLGGRAGGGACGFAVHGRVSLLRRPASLPRLRLGEARGPMGCGAPARFGQREAPCYPMRVRRATRRAPNPPNPENAGALRIRAQGARRTGRAFSRRALSRLRARERRSLRACPCPCGPGSAPPWRVAPSCASAPAPCAPRNGAARPSVPGVAAAPACLPCAPANGRRVRAEDIGR